MLVDNTRENAPRSQKFPISPDFLAYQPSGTLGFPVMSDQRSFHIRPLTILAFAVAVVSIVVAVVYFAMGHTKHGIAFLGLAVVAGIGVWFTSAPERERTNSVQEQ
jgi:uncharacterized membrane protein